MLQKLLGRSIQLKFLDFHVNFCSDFGIENPHSEVYAWGQIGRCSLTGQSQRAHAHTHTHCFVLWTVQGSGLGNLLYLNTSLCIWLAITFPHDWWLDVIIKKLFHQQTIIVFILCQFNPKEFLACHFLPGIWPEMLIFCFRKSLTMCWLVA